MRPPAEHREIEYSVFASSSADEMTRMLAATFCPRDPLAVAVGLTTAEFEAFVALLCPAAAAEGLTIVARNRSTGELVGALLTEDSATSLPDGVGRLSRKFDPIFDILGELESDDRRGVSAVLGESLHLFLLGVAAPAGGRGVAQQLVAACLENGARKGYRRAVTEATGKVSQHVFRKLGFSERVRRSYQEHRYNGRAVFASVAEHGGPILMVRSLAT